MYGWRVVLFTRGDAARFVIARIKALEIAGFARFRRTHDLHIYERTIAFELFGAAHGSIDALSIFAISICTAVVAACATMRGVVDDIGASRALFGRAHDHAFTAVRAHGCDGFDRHFAVCIIGISVIGELAGCGFGTEAVIQVCFKFRDFLGCAFAV